MRRLRVLIKTNLIIEKNIFFKKENEKVWTIIKSIFLLMLFYLAVDSQIVNCFSVLKDSNSESVIFKVILEAQFALISLSSLRSIISKLYIASDWRETYVYPVKHEIVLISKCILFYINNLMLATMFLVFLFTYGILNNEGLMFFIKVIIYQLLVAAVPVIYIVLISMTIVYFIGVIKKCIKFISRSSLILILDMIIGGYSYIIYKNAIHKTNGSIFDLLVKDGVQIVLCIGMILLFISSIYMVCGKLYLSIMKSGILKIERKSSDEIYFKRNNIILSNVIRDAKLLFRVPVVRSNCIILNQIYNLIVFGTLIIFNDMLTKSAQEMHFWKSVLILVLSVWYITFINWVPAMAFGREIDNLKELKVFPIKKRELLISKIILSIASNLLSFINLNVIAFMMSDGIMEFILYEVLIILWLLVVTILNIDYKEYENEPYDYEEVFSVQRIFGKIKYFNIFLVLWLAYFGVNYIMVNNLGSSLMGQINYGVLLSVGILILSISYKRIKNAC